MRHQRSSVAAVHLDTKYFAPVTGGEVFAAAMIVRKGKRIAHGEAVVRGAAGTVVAQGWGVFAVTAEGRLAPDVRASCGPGARLWLSYAPRSAAFMAATIPRWERRPRRAFLSAVRVKVWYPPARLDAVRTLHVADALADIAVGKPVNGTVEVAGPERMGLDEFVGRYLRANRDARKVTTEPPRALLRP